MAYAALLAFHALGAVHRRTPAQGLDIGIRGCLGPFHPRRRQGDLHCYRYDASIPGWPWTPRTTGWIEPTALFIIALAPTRNPAVPEAGSESGIELILDRKVPSGGWNFGNPLSRHYELEATVMSTALALAALGAAGVPESRPAVAEGIRYLTRSLAGEVSTASLAWTLLALRSFPGPGPARRRPPQPGWPAYKRPMGVSPESCSRPPWLPGPERPQHASRSRAGRTDDPESHDPPGPRPPLGLALTVRPSRPPLPGAARPELAAGLLPGHSSKSPSSLARITTRYLAIEAIKNRLAVEPAARRPGQAHRHQAEHGRRFRRTRPIHTDAEARRSAHPPSHRRRGPRDHPGRRSTSQPGHRMAFPPLRIRGDWPSARASGSST